jgi:hypothetical protein
MACSGATGGSTGRDGVGGVGLAGWAAAFLAAAGAGFGVSPPADGTDRREQAARRSSRQAASHQYRTPLFYQMLPNRSNSLYSGSEWALWTT